MKPTLKPLARSALIAGASLATLATVPLGHAQSAGLEEVIVTAQKREENLQDTPISLVALDARQLEKLGISRIGDLGSNVPNLQLSPHPNSATTPRVFIRGVGNFDDQITQDPSVAVYMDGVYVGRNQGMGVEVADIERIEVLRGPQGALYGRNATGGAINFLTRAPELGEWGFSQQLTAGNRDRFRSRTMLNAPLGEQLAARLFYLNSRQDGFVRNAGRGTESYGTEDHDAVRAELLFRPSEALDVRYAFDRSTMEDSPYYLAPVTRGVPPQRPSRSHAGNQQIKRGDVTTLGHHLTLNWLLHEDLTLRSITAYRDLDSYIFQDYLSGTGRPNTPLFIDNYVDQDQFSQEIQLLGSAFGEQLEYTLGLYYFTEDGTGDTVNWLPGFGIRQFTGAEIENEALAAYGQATYTPVALERLHITVGLRSSKDEREADLTRYNVLLSTNTILPASVGRGSGDKDFDDLSPSLTVAWDLSEDASVYAKVADGYKTGGFNMRASTIAYFEQGFDEETLRSYEVGLKAEWMDNRLRSNIAVFEADYQDIQINAQTSLTNPTVADILNGGEATIQGAELELSALVTDSLTLTLQYGYLDAGYDEVLDGFGRDVTDQFVFVNAPEHSYTVDVSWDIAATPVGELAANLNYTWQDEKYITATTNFGVYTIDAYGLLNARVTLSEIPVAGQGRLTLAAWGKNLEDNEYYFLNAPGFGGYVAWGEPRSYGIDLSYEF